MGSPARGDQVEPGKKADSATMSNAEVLDRAIATANANGWKGSVVYPGVYRSPEQLIYNHDFARALWGKEAPNNYCKMAGVDMWQYHLQQMVVADDPIAYPRRAHLAGFSKPTEFAHLPSHGFSSPARSLAGEQPLQRLVFATVLGLGYVALRS